MKSKLFHLGIILTSLIGYLEWGKDNSMFLIEGEIKVLSKLFLDPMSVTHPLTLMPLVGQLLVLSTLFQKKPRKILTYLGIGLIAVLLLFILFAGILDMNYKIILSIIPFLMMSTLTILHLRKEKSQ
jgi:hypothetical protein